MHECEQQLLKPELIFINNKIAQMYIHSSLTTLNVLKVNVFAIYMLFFFVRKDETEKAKRSIFGCYSPCDPTW
jgi:hypothetical protein